MVRHSPIVLRSIAHTTNYCDTMDGNNEYIATGAPPLSHKVLRYFPSIFGERNASSSFVTLPDYWESTPLRLSSLRKLGFNLTAPNCYHPNGLPFHFCVNQALADLAAGYLDLITIWYPFLLLAKTLEWYGESFTIVRTTSPLPSLLLMGSPRKRTNLLSSYPSSMLFRVGLALFLGT